jgi:VWFA-related protein
MRPRGSNRGEGIRGYTSSPTKHQPILTLTRPGPRATRDALGRSASRHVRAVLDVARETARPTIRRARATPLAFRIIPAIVFARVCPLVLLLISGTAAQQDSDLRVQSNLVSIPTLVKDGEGHIVYGLTQKDFAIDDDGVEQTVHLDDSAKSEPASVVVAIQTGRRAWREFSRMRGVGSMLTPVFNQLRSRVAVVEFDSHVNLIEDFSDDETSIDEDLKRLQPGDNGAAIQDAVEFSVRLLEKEPAERQRVLLLVSENRDHGSHFTKIDDVVAAIGSSNTVVYALAFSPSLSQVLDTERGSNRDEAHWNAPPDIIGTLLMARNAMKKNITRTIAEMTGGEYELFTSRKAFESRLVDFNNHLHSRYVLSFAPQGPHPGLHQIRVRLKQPPPGISVLSRTSYWAVGPTP